MTQALTPEVLERMKALDDPQVQKVLAGFKANVQTAVQQTFDALNKGVGDNVGELLGSVATKLSSAIQLLIADIPGWGIVMSGAQLADTGIEVAEKGKKIADEVSKTIAPINALQAQVTEVRSVVDAATPAIPQIGAPQTKVSESGASESGASESGAPQTEAPKSGQPKHKGGSRKRRRIHKLSRRIERTLRRVQKKYGLKDKNDFLRRTLRARKMK